MVSAFENLSQHNKVFIKFILEFIFLINDVEYIANQFKINLLFVKFSDKKN